MSLGSVILNYDGNRLHCRVEYDPTDTSEECNTMLFLFYKRLEQLLQEQPLRGDLTAKAELVMQYQRGDKPRYVVTHRSSDGDPGRQTVPDTMASLAFQYMTDPDTPAYNYEPDFLVHRFQTVDATAATQTETNP